MPLVKCPRCGEYTRFGSIRKAPELRCQKCGRDLLSWREEKGK